MGVGDVLAHNITSLFVDLCLWTYHLYSFTARASGGLHDVHVLIIRALTLNTEFSIVIWENVGFWAKVKFSRPLKHF